MLPPNGTVLEDVVDRLFRCFAIAECRVDWVCRGLVFSDPSPLASLAVSEQGFGLLVIGGGQGLQLFASKLC